MARAIKLWPVLLSAVLYILAFPSFNFWPLVFCCLVPWLFYLHRARARAAFWSGYLLGFLVVLEQMSFVQSLVLRWTNDSLLSIVPGGAAALIGAFYFAFLGWLINRCQARNWLWAIPFLWAGVEVMRSFVPGLAFPWFILANPLWHAPALIQPAFYFTIYFVSTVAVAVNVLVWFCLRLLQNRSLTWPPSVRTLAVFVGIYVGASVMMVGFKVGGAQRKIIVGQTGVDMAFGDPQARELAVHRSADALFQQAKDEKADILVLPEGLVEGGESLPPNTPFVVPEDVPVVFGGRRGGVPAYQTAYAYDGRWSYADKTRLVVFGEYVPGRDFLPFLKYFKLPSGDLKAASKVSSVDVNNIRVGPLLCFEGLFYDVAHKQAENGAQMLAIMSNDDWYMGTSAPEQLMTAAVWRAVETGLPVVRAASLGHSVAVDPRGRIIARAPLGQMMGLSVEILVQRAPPRNPLRPLFPWVASIFTVAMAFALKIRDRKPPEAAQL